MRTLKGILFVSALLRKIQTIKEIFMMDIEEGNEVLIPKDLS